MNIIINNSINHKNRIVILISIFFLSTVNLWAQKGGAPTAVAGPKNGVSGMVIDKHTKRGIPYTTVALYKQSDSSLVSGTITDDNGKFFIKAKQGSYYIDINFMGYNKVRKEISINKNTSFVKLGKITLSKSQADLKGVEIIGEQSYVDYKIDRKVINVSRDLASTGASAVEALQNVPSVTVDIEGDVQLRGSSNFTVLINGKPSPLSGGDALEQIPSSAIKNIEIITNPSAKYDPDGMTGIINVILKDNVKQGLNGIVEASAASFDSYGFNTTLNYRKEKWNYYGGVDLRTRNRPGDGISEMTNFSNPDTLFFRNSELDRHRNRNNYTFKAGVDYFANKRNSFGIEGAYGINNRGKDYFSKITEYYEPATIPTIYNTSHNTGGRESHFMKVNLSWQHKFKTKGDKLDVLAFINKGDYFKNEYQKEEYSDIDWNPDIAIKKWINTNDNNDNIDFRLKADYTKILKNNRKFEAGIQSRNYRENSTFVYHNFDTLNNDWEIIPQNGNTLVFNRDIFSIYSTYGGSINNFGYQLGLRGEYTNRFIESSEGNSGSKINRFDIFPTIHLSQKINDKNSVMASYSRRIDRPGGWELGPNPMFISSTFIRVGNPELEPEYTDSYEISYQTTFSKSFVSLEGYYRTTKNKISRIQEMDPNTYITTMTFANLDRDHSAGMEAMANLQLAKWVRLNVSGNYYYYKLLGNISSGSVDAESWNYDIRGNVNFMITPLMRLQLTTFYRGPSVTAQGEFSSFYMFNSALRYDFFKRKLAVTFKVNNITNSMQHAFTTSTTDFATENVFRSIGPTFSLTATYKINNYKKKSKPTLDDKGGSDGGDI